MKIAADEAFSTLRKWQVEQTPIVLVGSLMPKHLLRGQIAVVTREGTWDQDYMPPSIWGFNLHGKETNFLASKFKDFERLPIAKISLEIRNSLQGIAKNAVVLAITQTMELVRHPRREGDPLASVPETFFLAEDASVQKL